MKIASWAAIAAVIILAPAGPFRAQAQTVQPRGGTIDLFETLGIKLPQGEELAQMIAQAARHPLGSRENPVRAAGVDGQRAYLSRLRCADGKAPRYERAFSDGIGPFGRIMDHYNLWCGDMRVAVRLDMYHPGYVEARPVPGFTIRKAKGFSG